MDIRLKEFLHNLKDHDFDVCGQYKVDENEANKVIEALEDDGWILCSERLPEKVDIYIVALPDIDFCNWDGSCFGWYSDGKWQKNDEVIAWQPLPEWRGENDS